MGDKSARLNRGVKGGERDGRARDAGEGAGGGGRRGGRMDGRGPDIAWLWLRRKEREGREAGGEGGGCA